MQGGNPATPEEVGNRDRIGRLSELASHAREYARSNKNPKTLDREQRAFARLIGSLGDIPLKELTPALVEEYKTTRLKTVSPSTLNVEVRVLNVALSQAFSLGMIPARLGGFKQIRVPEPEAPHWLTRAQIAQLLEVCNEDECRFVVFLANTGVRRNEALGMEWQDVNLVRGQIVVRSEIAKMARRRTIPISDELMRTLSAWPTHQGRLFPVFTPNQITMAFRRRCRAAGLPKGTSVHTLRSSFACALIEKGVDVYSVAKLLGHASIRTTEKHYLTVDPLHIRKAVNKLDLTGPPKGDNDDEE
jgi:integrase